MTTRRLRLHLAILLTAFVSASLAGAGVAVRWIGIHGAPAQTMNPALWAARSFLSYFDVLAFLCFVPCWHVTVQFERKIKQAELAAEENPWP